MCEIYRMPSFFKIIFKGITDKYLEIPAGFVKHLTDFRSCATLRGPSGHSWDVKMTRLGESIFMQDGWQMFYKDHGLGDNEFLTFSYLGGMSFDVLILNKSGSEVFYDSEVGKNQEPALLDGKTKRVSVEATQRCASHGQDKMKEEPCLETVAGKNFMDHSKGNKVMARTRLSSRTRGNKVTARTRADSFTSELPHFKRVMCKANVGRPFQLNIPKSFSTRQLPSLKTRIVLRNTKGKRWQTNYCRTRNGMDYIGGGWPAFLRANKLRENDVCIFELVDRTELLVHIFR